MSVSVKDLSSYESIENTVKRNTDSFDFVETLGSFIQNREFSEGFQHYEFGNDSNKTYIWEVLSKIGQRTGEVIYENVLNYIDYVSNVDLCKIQALRSMIRELGISYKAFQDIEKYPEEILNLLDVLSINKKYLLNNKVVDQNLINLVMNDTYVEGSKISDLSGTNYISGYIDDDKYNDFLYTLFCKTLSSFALLPYNYETSSESYDDYIYNHISNDLLDKQTEIKEHIENVRIIKIRNGIPVTFDEQKIVDNIEIGKDSLENYSGARLNLLQQEIDYRNKPLESKSEQQNTRYSYYREEKVKQYFSFIEQMYYSLQEDERVKNRPYEVDNNYMELKNIEKQYLYGVYSLDKDLSAYYNNSYNINFSMIGEVAQKLTNFSLWITRLRDQLKTQTIKNYMKGTWNLISYVINDYLNEFPRYNTTLNSDDNYTAVRNALLNHSIDDVNIIEYDDITEYYNLSTENSSKAKNGKFVNERFWENDEYRNSYSGFAFNEGQIQQFYLSVLNMKDKVGSLETFLSGIYSSGADKSYLDKDGNRVIVSDNSDLSAYNEQIYLSYNGNKFGYDPYFNHKNITHSSFQLHPYLYNFVESTKTQYPIINAFNNDINDSIEDSLISSLISQYIGKFGEMINIWLNNSYDFSGYKTRYESSPHQGKGFTTSNKISVIDYDGLFYPPALEEFLNNPEKCIDEVRNRKTTHVFGAEKTYYEKYYSHLALQTDEEYIHIADQLSANIDNIRDISKSSMKKSDIYDIYKYGRDAYDNMYILLKKYDKDNPSYDEMKNTTGQLWIRKKDHPLAIPAVYGENPQVDRDIKYINGKFTDIMDEEGMAGDKSHMSYFYDMDFDITKKALFLMYYPVNDEERYKERVIEFKHPFYKSLSHCDIMVINIDEYYDLDKKYTKLRFLKDTAVDIDTIYNPTILQTEGKITEYVGMYRNGQQHQFLFIKKDCDENLYTRIGDNQSIYITQFSYIYHTPSGYSEKTFNLSFGTQNRMYQIVDNTEFKFEYYDQILTFACQTRLNNPNIIIQNYLGDSIDKKHTEYGLADYMYHTSCDISSTEYNSFDKLNYYITVIETNINGDELQIINNGLVHYNLNADPSYIPLYPNLSGFISTLKDDYYNSQEIKRIELLGYSNNIDNEISNTTTADTLIDLSSIRNLINGRVYEDYRGEDDYSVIVRQNDYLYHGEDTGTTLMWEISLADYTQRELSGLDLILLNTETFGRNPYFCDSLSALIDGKEHDVYYMDEAQTAEITSINDNEIRINGTYNWFTEESSRVDNNHIKNIQRITIQYNKRYASLRILFYVDDVKKSCFIKKKLLNLYLCNNYYINMYRFYHFIDSYNIVSSDNGGSDIELINTSYIISNDQKVYLSSFNFRDFNNLSDISFLSGFENNLAFKYSEEEVYTDKDNINFYDHGYNDKFPIRVVDFFKYSFNIVDQKNLFNDRSYFVFNIENPKLMDEVGLVDIPITNIGKELLIAFEDYDDGKYGTEDPYIYEFLDCYATEELNDVQIVETENVDLEGNKISAINISDIEIEHDYMDNVSRKLKDKGIEAQRNEKYVSDTQRYYKRYESHLSDLTEEEIAELFNIYVNYKKTDNGITLYFNYYNFINSPFSKFVDSDTKLDWIDGTYLKLEPNQDGILDIVVQFRYYSGDDLFGVKNGRLVSYQIFNVSDDKPKFLIRKISQIKKDSLMRTLEPALIRVQPEIQDISDTDVTENMEIDYTIRQESIGDYSHLEYNIFYNNDELVALEYPSFIEKKYEGMLHYSADSMITDYTIKFKLVKKLGTTSSENEINIIIGSEDGEGNTKAETVDAVVECYQGGINLIYTNVLRKETYDSEKLIGLEPNEETSIENIKAIRL